MADRPTLPFMEQRILQKFCGKKICSLAFPYPFKAWLALSNDPDNTTLDRFHQIDRFIWKELGLPFGDAVFIRSFNQNLKDQVNVFDHPEIAQAHPIDGLHTWGDYVFARQKAFDREDAIENIKICDQAKIRPKVWVDHADSTGNMQHRSARGSTPIITDTAGHQYTVFEYTLDLVEQIGIRYIWDGELTSILGQDILLSRFAYYRHLRNSALNAAVVSFIDKLLKKLIHAICPDRLSYKADNTQYFPHQFSDGRKLYCFRRYGTWRDADIDGLANVIAPQRIDLLIERKGSCIAYTHLGKQKAARNNQPAHIPEQTMQALRYVKEQYDRKELNCSSVSQLLDYLVLRDHIVIEDDRETIRFRPDQIRFQHLDEKVLAGFQFSFRIPADLDPRVLTIQIEDQTVKPDIVDHGAGLITIRF